MDDTGLLEEENADALDNAALLEEENTVADAGLLREDNLAEDTYLEFNLFSFLLAFFDFYRMSLVFNKFFCDISLVLFTYLDVLIRFKFDYFYIYTLAFSCFTRIYFYRFFSVLFCVLNTLSSAKLVLSLNFEKLPS